MQKRGSVRARNSVFSCCVVNCSHFVADPGIVSGSPDPTDRKKSSDNLELGILHFTVEVQWFILRNTIDFQVLRRVPSFSKWG